MKKVIILVLLLTVAAWGRSLFSASAGLALASGVVAEKEQSPTLSDSDEDWIDDEWADDEAGAATIADPLEPLNRLFFQINDKLYFWLLKPVARGYAAVLPKDVRLCIRNGFANLQAPVRVVNNLLQGKVKGSGIELARFVINSTLGIAGLADPARNEFHLAAQEEDLGQTLGSYGMGGGIYLCLPLFGPSNIRDSIGLAGDMALDPLAYLPADEFSTAIGVQSGKRINDTSLSLGDYEKFKDASFDPYLALRSSYQQNRQGKIDE